MRLVLIKKQKISRIIIVIIVIYVKFASINMTATFTYALLLAAILLGRKAFYLIDKNN